MIEDKVMFAYRSLSKPKLQLQWLSQSYTNLYNTGQNHIQNSRLQGVI